MQGQVDAAAAKPGIIVTGFLPQIRREEEGSIPRWKWVDHIEQVGKR